MSAPCDTIVRALPWPWLRLWLWLWLCASASCRDVGCGGVSKPRAGARPVPANPSLRPKGDVTRSLEKVCRGQMIMIIKRQVHHALHTKYGCITTGVK